MNLLKQEIAAIETGIRNEFTIGELSGDVLQDFATFIEHHNKLEAQFKELEKQRDATVRASAFVTEKLEKAQNMLKLANQDWAEDDTDIRNICRPIISKLDCDGNSSGVPNVTDVVASAIKELERQLANVKEQLRISDEGWAFHNKRANDMMERANRFEKQIAESIEILKKNGHVGGEPNCPYCRIVTRLTQPTQ